MTRAEQKEEICDGITSYVKEEENHSPSHTLSPWIACADIYVLNITDAYSAYFTDISTKPRNWDKSVPETPCNLGITDSPLVNITRWIRFCFHDEELKSLVVISGKILSSNILPHYNLRMWICSCWIAHNKYEYSSKGAIPSLPYFPSSLPFRHIVVRPESRRLMYKDLVSP